MIILAYRRPEW